MSDDDPVSVPSTPDGPPAASSMMWAHVGSNPPAVVGVSRVEAGVACLRCGYDLRGLPPTGLCPECGAEVIWSIQRQSPLRLAPPAHLAALQRGASSGSAAG